MSCNTLGCKWASATALVIAHSFDDPRRVLTAVRFASLSNRKIVLAQVSGGPSSGMHEWGGRRRRIVRQEMPPRAASGDAEWPKVWSEILNKVFLLGDVPPEDVPDIARGMEADHLLFCSQHAAEAFWKTTDRYDTAAICDVPMWVMGRSISPRAPEGIQQILLPLSFRNDFEGRLRTASQLANAAGATLVILHVQSHEENAFEESCAAWALSARLRDCLDRLLGGPRRIQISVCDGDPAEAILKFESEHPHSLILMRGSGACAVERSGRGVTRRVLSEASCPVVLTRTDLSVGHAWMNPNIRETLSGSGAIARGPGGVQ